MRWNVPACTAWACHCTPLPRLAVRHPLAHGRAPPATAPADRRPPRPSARQTGRTGLEGASLSPRGRRTAAPLERAMARAATRAARGRNCATRGWPAAEADAALGLTATRWALVTVVARPAHGRAQLDRLPQPTAGGRDRGGRRAAGCWRRPRPPVGAPTRGARAVLRGLARAPDPRVAALRGATRPHGRLAGTAEGVGGSGGRRGRLHLVKP